MFNANNSTIEKANFINNLSGFVTKKATLNVEENTFEQWQWKAIISYLNSNSAIDTLIANYCEIDDSIAEIIAGAKHLSVISLFNNNITGIGANKLAQLSLKELDLSVNPIKDGAMEQFASANIKKLSFSACYHMDSKAVSNLFINPHIVVLRLNEVIIKDEIFIFLKDNTTLKELDISSSRVYTYRAMDYIAENTSIEKLNISMNTYIADVGIEKLAAKNSLISLTAAQIGLTDTAVKALIKIPNLLNLNVIRNNFTEEGIKQLKENIKNVWVSGTNCLYAESTVHLLDETSDSSSEDYENTAGPTYF